MGAKNELGFGRVWSSLVEATKGPLQRHGARTGSLGERLGLAGWLDWSVEGLTKKLRPSIYGGSGDGKKGWRQGVDGQRLGNNFNDTGRRKRGGNRVKLFL